MGRDKARLEVEGEALYARVAAVLGELCDEVVLASGPTARIGDQRWREVADARPGDAERTALRAGASAEREGPLAALVAGLALAAHEGFDGVVTAPCDVPQLAVSALRPLQWAVATPARGDDPNAEGTRPDVAHWRRGERDEPLCAALSVRALATLAAAFERGVRRPMEAFAELRSEVREAPAALAEALTNVNTPEDLARVARPTAPTGAARPGAASSNDARPACTGDGA